MSMDTLAEEYWVLGLEASPMMATLYGLPGHDDKMGDPSVEFEMLLDTKLRDLSTRVEATTPNETQDKITRQMLLEVIKNDLNETKFDTTGMMVSPLTGPHSGLLRVAAQVTASSAEQAADFLTRYRKVGDWLGTFAARHVASVKKGRTHTAVNVQHVLDQVDGYLASALESDPFVNTALRFEWDGEDEWRAELEDVVTTVVRPAMKAYRDRLEAEALPSARGDHEPGLLHVPDGVENYAALLAQHTTTDLTADQIHEIGLEMMKKLRLEFGQIGEAALGLSDAAEVIDRLRSDRTLKFESAEEMVATAQGAILRAEAAVPNWFNVYPEAKCAVQEVEPELAPSMPPAYYMPPSQDGTRGGTFFINTYLPETRGTFDAEAIAFHEAVPGHHFDRSVSGELTDIPMFRKLGIVTVFTEGWGLYSERLADEMGLYSSEVARLGMVSADAWRAGRLVVDTGIHAKGWTRQQAIDYLVANVPIAEGVIAQEVDRYISMPGQAVSYMVGRRALDAQRKRAEDSLGDDFDIKHFHDIALTNGAVPLRIFEDLVSYWIGA